MPLGEVGASDVGGARGRRASVADRDARPFSYALGSGARRPPGDNFTPMAHSRLRAPRRRPLDDLMAEARRLRAGHRRHVLAEGLRPADDALPRRLRLLHVRAAAAARRARLPHRGRGARDRTRRRRGRLHRGAVHARRPAGGALPRRARRARGARLRDDARVPRALRRPRPRRDGAPAAPEPRA